MQAWSIQQGQVKGSWTSFRDFSSELKKPFGQESSRPDLAFQDKQIS